MTTAHVTALEWRTGIAHRVAAGERFAGLYGTAVPGGCRLTAVLAAPGGFELVQLFVGSAVGLRYSALTPLVPSAFWWERAAADLSGVVPVGHPRPEPLLLPVEEGSVRPQPGLAAESTGSDVRHLTPPGPIDVTGRGLFTIAYGPVRSGVGESIEFLVETPGEEIPRLNIRPHFKHRGIAKAFEGHAFDDGVLVAERVEGIASVAHATAYSHAIEELTGTRPPWRAQLLRVVLAELERTANHLDVAVKLSDAAGLAVATSRFGWHKESVMRLMGRLTGSRFGRALVVPGGLAREPGIPPAVIAAEARTLRDRIAADARLLMRTPSFLDRLRGTGRLDAAHAREWGALGPLGRGSGVDDDDRWSRPTDAYAALTQDIEPAVSDGTDALARLRVRWAEVDTGIHMLERACAELVRLEGAPLRAAADDSDAAGTAVGWAEAPHGEIVYVVETSDGRITRCFARTPSLHNLVLFHDVFRGDVLTDFAFIEASFGLSAAGAAM